MICNVCTHSCNIVSFRSLDVSRIETHEKTKNDEEGNVYAPSQFAKSGFCIYILSLKWHWQTKGSASLSRC